MLMYVMACRIMPGHNGCAAGGANGIADVELQELGSFGRQPVKIGCGDGMMPVKAQVTVSPVIRINEDDIGLLGEP